MRRRVAAIVIGLLDVLGWIFVAVATFRSNSDPATIGFDLAAGSIVSGLFLMTAAPGLALALANRAPRAALILTIAFPAAFALLFIAAVVIFA
jgi:hypothetical protein